jgi:transcriptional regulator with XRE-family HTH domain
MVSGLSRSELAVELGVTEAAVSYWIAGHRLPEPDTVFAIERVLQTPPGHLSRHLGYLPVEADMEVREYSVEVAIQAAPLSGENKQRLLDLYRSFVRHERQIHELRRELDEGS